MASTAGADAITSENTTYSDDKMNHEPDVSESTNHDLPARTLAESERPEYTSAQEHDDPATTAASEELKHTTLSDKRASLGRPRSPLAYVQTDSVGEDKDMGDTGRASTPEAGLTDAQDEEMKERLASPKKKRGRDQDDEFDNVEDDAADGSSDGSVVNGSRTTRLEPEKKRPRDTSEDTSKLKETPPEVDMKTTPAKSANTEFTTLGTSNTTDKTIESTRKDLTSPSSKPQTSASAFAKSGFASLAASSTSPFGSIGATKPSVFGGSTQTSASGFGALAAAKPAESASSISTSGFGALAAKSPTGFSFGGAGTSGFGSLASGSVFGAKLGNGFAGGSGPKLSSFAAPGKDIEIVGAKPAKAFGAPESDEDAGSDEDEDSDGEPGEEDLESGKVEVEDKKKVKLSRVQVDDGESGEATLLQVRAKIFVLTDGWKERGVGVVKVSVPLSCVGYEHGEQVFDPTGIEDEAADTKVHKVPRLIMRQENTHRVILNTTITKFMTLKDKLPATSSAQILFTAFESTESKPVPTLLKMSEANGKLFRSMIESIREKLPGPPSES